MSNKSINLSLRSQISHEIRIPLSAILNLINFLQETNLTNEQASYVHDIEISANRLLDAQVKINHMIKPSVMAKS